MIRNDRWRFGKPGDKGGLYEQIDVSICIAQRNSLRVSVLSGYDPIVGVCIII